MSNKPEKTKILMVCLGNICRSPLAHGILESKLPKDKYFVDSAGTSAYHIGNKPDPRSIAVAKSNGLDITNQKARQFSASDFKDFDIIYAMDTSNYYNMIALAKNESDKAKVKLILEKNSDVSIKDVPDPYYGGDSAFDYVFEILNESCENITRDLLK